MQKHPLLFVVRKSFSGYRVLNVSDRFFDGAYNFCTEHVAKAVRSQWPIVLCESHNGLSWLELWISE